MTKRTWRWVTRDCHDDWQADVWSSCSSPVKFEYGWSSDGAVASVEVDFLEGSLGLTIPTDRPVRVEFSARVIEDDDSAGLVVGDEEVK